MEAGRKAMSGARAADAVEHFTEALRVVPSQPTGWLALAGALAGTGERAEAVAAARRALEHRPAWVPALWHLAGYQWLTGERADALATVGELCTATRLDSRAGTHARIVLHAIRRGCSNDVVEALFDAQMTFTEEELGEAIAPMEMGRRAFGRREYELAEEIFKGVEMAEGVRPWTSLWLSRTYNAMGRIDDAFAALARGIAVTDDRRMLGIELAELHAARGDRDEAIAVLEGLHRRSVGDAELASEVARRLIGLGAHESALSVAESALSAGWSSACAIARAVARWHLADPSEAERLVADEASPLSSDECAELALQIGSPLAAWTRLREGDELASNGTLLWRTAHALRRNGHLRAALEAFEASAASEAQAAESWAARTAGEIGLLCGGWRPPLLRHERFIPIEGRVLNIVGKSLPHAQTGYTIRTHSEAKVQLEIGLEPHVVTQLGFPWTIGVDAAAAEESIDGVTYHRLLTGEPIPERLDELTTANALELADLIARLRPSVLHAASDFRNPLMALAAARHFGLPLVYTVRGFWQETWLSKHSVDALESDAYRWRAERELECMHEATHVVTIAETMKELIVASGIPAEKVTVVPNAVDADEFHPVPRSSALAESLGIAPDETVLGYISSFTGYEGIVYLIDAAAMLIERGHQIRVLLVGDGEERARLQARAGERGIADRVIFTGRVPHGDVLDYYGVIDVFVVPRTADRVSQLVTPLKPYEAMATERAVIVSGVPALREMIVEGVTGLSFVPESAGSLADVVEPLIGDRDRRRELGRAAREWVVAHRTWRANGDRIASVLEQAAVSPPAT
jgi:glycosyltransferase involved in cell wall biosynthesis/tetratricopeptide (TPR) repeat protein